MSDEVPSNNESDSLKLEHEKDLIQVLNNRRDLINASLDNYKKDINAKYDSLFDKIVKQYTYVRETYMNEFPETYQEMMNDPRNKILKFLKVEEITRKGIDYNLQNFAEYLASIDMETVEDTSGTFVGNALLNEKLFNEKYDYSIYSFDKNNLFGFKLFDQIRNKKNSENISYTITDEDSRKQDRQFLHENSAMLLGLEFYNIKNNIDKYFDNPNGITYPKLTSIQFKECSFEDPKEPIDAYVFTKLESVVYNNSLPNTVEKIQQFIPFNISSQLNALTSIKFEKANIVNSEFFKIMTSIIAIDDLRRRIKIISFADNQLSSIDFKKKFSLSAIKTFDSIEEFNFSSNRLYTFKISYQNVAKKLKFLNLIDNHFSALGEIDQPKDTDGILCLCNRNLFLTSDANLAKYTESLKKILPKYNYANLEYMSFSGLFHCGNSKNLLEFEINPSIYSSLIELDLSYCGLNTSVVIDYLKKSTKLIKLRDLNLKANFIDMEFFEQYNKQFENKRCLVFLENLNLSNNSIKDENFDYVYQFILNNKNLKFLNLQMNAFGKEYHAEKIQFKQESSSISMAMNTNALKDYSTPKPEEKTSSSNDKQSNMIYKVSDPDPNATPNKMNFIDLIRALYSPENNTNEKLIKKFYLDFSTESRLLDTMAIEKNKKYYYNITFKKSSK